MLQMRLHCFRRIAGLDKPTRAFADRLLFFPAETRPGRRQGTPPTTSRASPSLPYFCLFFAMAISPFRCICGAQHSLSKDRGAPAPSLGRRSKYSGQSVVKSASIDFSSYIDSFDPFLLKENVACILRNKAKLAEVKSLSFSSNSCSLIMAKCI